jgi:GxxExxY protein
MYEVVGAAMEVHSILGHGMAEAIYQEALAVEMKKRGMDAEREKELRLQYQPQFDDFILLNHDNYKNYITDNNN